MFLFLNNDINYSYILILYISNNYQGKAINLKNQTEEYLLKEINCISYYYNLIKKRLKSRKTT